MEHKWIILDDSEEEICAYCSNSKDMHRVCISDIELVVIQNHKWIWIGPTALTINSLQHGWHYKCSICGMMGFSFDEHLLFPTFFFCTLQTCDIHLIDKLLK